MATSIDDARLYDWLGAGLDKHGFARIDGEHQKRVAAWLTARPERYKAVLLAGAARCIGKENVWSCLFHCASRLYYAEPPADIVPWYLERAAAESHGEFQQFYFAQAARQLIRQGGQEWLTLDALDYLAPWVARTRSLSLSAKFRFLRHRRLAQGRRGQKARMGQGSRTAERGLAQPFPRASRIDPRRQCLPANPGRTGTGLSPPASRYRG
jgi:hypothetical protein